MTVLIKKQNYDILIPCLENISLSCLLFHFLPHCVFPSNCHMDRPRRTTRQPVKTAKVLVAPDPAPRIAKRKVDPEQRLNTLLESSKSELVSMELPVRI
jgi:hypothetical protein